MGVEKWSGGTSYEGEFKLGMKHGIGKYKFEDGSIYEGESHEN